MAFQPSTGPGRSIAVLVELAGGPPAGGQVKCWERFAEAAASIAPGALGIDLTLYLLGSRESVVALSPAVRIVSLRPVLGTGRFTGRLGGVDATDLTPYHPRLAELLPRHDVWHLTHMFGFAATALRLARRHPPGRLVASLHTNVPVLATTYVAQLLRSAWPLRLLSAGGPRVDPALIAGRLLRRRRDRFLRACDAVLVATPQEQAEIRQIVGAERVGLLGRGIDARRFAPRPGPEQPQPPVRPFTVLFVGRVDASKRVLVVGEAVRLLRAGGRPVRLLVAGDGADLKALSRLLGDAVTPLGSVPQHSMADVYADGDVLAFPSHSETAGNVVAEAMACGRPVLLPAGARTTAWLARPGLDGALVRDDTPRGWAFELARLMDEPARRRSIGEQAAHTSRTRHRSWPAVLVEDLLPAWGVGSAGRRPTGRPGAELPARHR
ncbi:glycosyltransferase [Plantactinospora sp. WMMB782]|uniref:glycosyltransferase n=1 Tax=Plantactinospora sp. WMMB782 TaxID=3404121 RepID=UPI003B9481E8